MPQRLISKLVDSDLSTPSGRALIEERYGSLRQQVPIVYLLGLINVSAMEVATTGGVSPGLNLPTFIAACGLLRLSHWFGPERAVDHEGMVRRMNQTLWFAVLVCGAVCLRSLYLLHVGDTADQMAVMLFGGLTAIGVAYGLTALPAAGRIPLILIIGPISVAALLSTERHFVGAAFALVVVAALTMRLLIAHGRHFQDVITSRAAIAREQQVAEDAHRQAVVAATTDFLTGLPNRRAFVAALDAILAGEAGKAGFGIAILDLDRFKAVNDTFGHQAGDRLLKKVAAALLKAMHGEGLIARLGGDEFGVLLPHVRNPVEAQAAGARLIDAVNNAAIARGSQALVSACCGVALSRTGKDTSPSRLMADADLALYQAKEQPSGSLALFELSMEAPRRRRIEVERALQAPGVHRDLRLVFQPIFNLASGKIIAHEALARWTHPELGAVAPSEFVPIAEQLNLIEDINSHLMRVAFESAARWPGDVQLSFNLSAVQLCSPGSAAQILAALDSAGLAPSRLQVEVTETALLADFERARANLTRLRHAGATIVLDDFGAGYASIAYLRELRFDQIKLDGGLVTAAQLSADGKRLLRAVVGLCDMLGVTTVAEHVESEALLRLVTELGCTAGQGFWLKPPVRAEDLPLPSNVRRLQPRRRRAAA